LSSQPESELSVQPASADAEESRLARLAHSLSEEAPHQRLSRRMRVAMTLGPLVGFGLLALAAYLAAGYGAAAFLTVMEVGSFAGVGKFVILGGAHPDAPLGVWWLAGLVVYGDLGTTLVMMANMTLLYHTPFIGQRLVRIHEASWYMLRAHPWMRRTAWLGVAAFVAAPFQGTGAVGGTLLGRLLGLPRLATLSATAAGSMTGCTAVALLGTYARERIQAIARNPVAAVLAVVITIGLFVVLGRWFMGKSPRGRQAAEQGDSDASG